MAKKKAATQRRKPKGKTTGIKADQQNQELSARLARLKTASERLMAQTEHVHRAADSLHHQSDQLHQQTEATYRQGDDVHTTARERRPTTGAAATAPARAEKSKRGKGAATATAKPTSAPAPPQAKDTLPFTIAGIGASAGGFEAYGQLLGRLPADTGMAFVLVQHLDPSHESKLTELLARSTTLPVTEVRHGMKIEPNHVYVMPHNTYMTVAQDRLMLSPRKVQPGTPPMPIDSFFRSLASELENRAIGVVLSGTGTDGTLGLQAIKGEGGITMAQDEKSSKYFGMPGSAIGADCVDFILPPQGIARELARIARHPYVSRAPIAKAPQVTPAPAELEKLLPEESQELHQIFGFLRARTGVDFTLYKPTTLKRRIVRRMVLHKLDALTAYVRYLREHPNEIMELFNDLLINVTGFFRDPQAFQVLRRKIFPKLIKDRPTDAPLRFWVVGCSTGEEAYSLAMCITEFFDQNHSVWPVQIFGTDINDAAIEKARAGIYPENTLADIPPERLRRFFLRTQGVYQVNKAIRDMCVFARQNVTVDPPFSNLDLISCRNVLIYLSHALQKKIIPVFHYALKPQGYLLLGGSEAIGSSADLFTLLDKKNKIYARKETALRPAAAFGHRKYEAPPEKAEPPPVPELRAPDLQQQVDRLILNRYSPAAVVINGQFEVLQFRGRTGTYLEHPPGAASLNLLKMAREGLAMDLRTVISRAMKQGVPVKQEGARLRANGHTRDVLIEVMPFKLPPQNEPLFLVLFQDTTSPAEPGEAREGASRTERSRQHADARELTILREEMAATRESLQAIIEEQEATNEELKSANEEIQSSNEELQSTNEELETAKEELQSTNEELTTLNEELQTRNTELSQVNNDLTNLLSSVTIPVIMLGNDFTVRRFTPMAEKIFNLIPSDIGRRLSDLNRTVVAPDLDKLIQDVIDNLRVIERQVQDREGRWYTLQIRPYRTQDNKIDGAVIILLDIDQLRRGMEEMMGIIHQPLLILHSDLRVQRANESFLQTFHVNLADIAEKPFAELGQGQWNIPELQRLLREILPKQQRVENYRIEAEFPQLGRRAFLVSGRKFYEEGRGIDLILLAWEDVTGQS